MNSRLKTRLQKLERQYGASEHTAEKIQERMARAVLKTLSDAELDALEQYYWRSDNEGAEAANAEQKAAWEKYEQRYREFRTSGKLTVNGCDVLGSDTLPPASACRR